MGKPARRAGVIGVGNMGRHHARIYNELGGVDLVGVSDVDESQARTIADEYDCRPLARDALLDEVELVSIATPTATHAEHAQAAIDRGVHLLVEKPFVSEPAAGRQLLDSAREAGLTLQVGHVERFNPAVEVLTDVLADLELVAVNARRLGPPIGRNVGEGVVLDLMVHDIDILLSIVNGSVRSVEATGTHDNQYVTATIGFDCGVVGSLTASRLTQQKVRKLAVTARECQVNVDYLDQSVHIHRRSMPDYVTTDGAVRYRNESVIERPTVETGEPLQRELRSFLDAIADGTPPIVTGEDGLRALELALMIDDRARTNAQEVTVG